MSQRQFRGQVFITTGKSDEKVRSGKRDIHQFLCDDRKDPNPIWLELVAQDLHDSTYDFTR